MAIKVRLAEIRDLASIAMIYHLNRAALGRSLTPDELRDWVINPFKIAHVAESNGRVTAFGLMEERLVPDRHLYLANTASDPRFPVAGDAHAINKARIAFARQKSIGEIRGDVEADNERSLAFYSADGFIQDARPDDSHFVPIFLKVESV